jgi:hypothetical protein
MYLKSKTQIDVFDVTEGKGRIYIRLCLYTGYKQIKENSFIPNKRKTKEIEQ